MPKLVKKMKRFVDIRIPIETCNFRCKYCYIAQQHRFDRKPSPIPYDPEFIRKALSVERMGGICHFNICGDGETLIPKEMPKILSEIIQEGHYVFVVTNGSMSSRFDEILDLIPPELLKHLGFKFSFHYQELIRLNILDKFFENVHKVWDAGCSISLELTPCDELIPLIPEIKELCLKEVGALCHVTVARDNRKKDIPILTNLNREEYLDTWRQFDSPLFEYKMSTFNVKRREFCYAGAWGGVLDLNTGILSQCYLGKGQNIFDNLSDPIDFDHCIGYRCKEAHCFNSHAFLTLGFIPELESPFYFEMRNRVSSLGKEWLSAEMKSFLSHKLNEENNEYSENEKTKLGNSFSISDMAYYFIHNILRPILYFFKKGNYNE